VAGSLATAIHKSAAEDSDTSFKPKLWNTNLRSQFIEFQRPL
jgi:hypothetical protein